MESDEDCFNLAVYELWKASRNNVTITIKVQDNFVYKFDRMSHVVGEYFFEYKIKQGHSPDVQSDSILCILSKASLSNNVWTLELKPFYDYVMSYTFYDTHVYYIFKSNCIITNRNGL